MDPDGRWTSTRAVLLAAAGQNCWPPAGSYMAATGQDLMAADSPPPSANTRSCEAVSHCLDRQSHWCSKAISAIDGAGWGPVATAMPRVLFDRWFRFELALHGGSRAVADVEL